MTHDSSKKPSTQLEPNKDIRVEPNKDIRAPKFTSLKQTIPRKPERMPARVPPKR